MKRGARQYMDQLRNSYCEVFETESQTVMKRRLVRVAFTSVVFAPAIDVRRLFRGFALGPAILP